MMNYKIILYTLLIVSAIVKLIIINKNKDNKEYKKPYKKYVNIFSSIIILVIVFFMVFFR